jgi:hypothetical protein
MRPTNGSSMPRRRAKVRRSAPGSRQSWPRPTCMFTTWRVTSRSPPTTAEAMTRSGAALRIHTVSGRASISIPGITRASRVPAPSAPVRAAIHSAGRVVAVPRRGRARSPARRLPRLGGPRRTARGSPRSPSRDGARRRHPRSEERGTVGALGTASVARGSPVSSRVRGHPGARQSPISCQSVANQSKVARSPATTWVPSAGKPATSE